MKCPTTSSLTHWNNLRGQLESLGCEEESLVWINYHCTITTTCMTADMSDPPNQPQWHHIFPFSQHLLHETKPKLNQQRAPTLLCNIIWYLIVDYGLCLYPCQPSKHTTLHLWTHTWTLWWVLMAVERCSFAPWKHLEATNVGSPQRFQKQRQRMLLRPPSRCSPPQTAAKEGRPVSFTSGHNVSLCR